MQTAPTTEPIPPHSEHAQRVAGSYPGGIEGESELDSLLPSVMRPSAMRPFVFEPFDMERIIERYMPSIKPFADAIKPYARKPFAIDAIKPDAVKPYDAIKPFVIDPFVIDPFAIDAIKPYTSKRSPWGSFAFERFAIKPDAIKRPGAMQWSRLVKPHGPGGEEGDRMEGGLGSDSSTTPSAYNTWEDALYMATNTKPLLLGDWLGLDEVGSLKKHTKLFRDALEAYGPKKDAAPHPLMQYLYGETLAIHSEFAKLFYEFVAERQNAEAAVKAQVAELERKICVLKEENERDANFLTVMTDTSWMGSSHRSEADNLVLPLFDWTSAPDSAI